MSSTLTTATEPQPPDWYRTTNTLRFEGPGGTPVGACWCCAQALAPYGGRYATDRSEGGAGSRPRRGLR